MKQTIILPLCPGCKASFPLHKEGPIDLYYGLASLECYDTFFEVINKAGTWAHGAYLPVHRLIADIYPVQHPPQIGYQKKLGIAEDQIQKSVQLFSVHFIALYMIFEKQASASHISTTLDHILAHNKLFEPLTPPENRGAFTVVDVLKAQNFEEHQELVLQWGWSVWQAWQAHHATAQQWYEQYALHM